MLYFVMDFRDLTSYGLIGTGALSSALPGADIGQIKYIPPQIKQKEGLLPDFQIMVANGQLETPIATAELKYQVGDMTFLERFIVMANLVNPLIELSFLQRNGTVLDMRQGLPKFDVFLHAAQRCQQLAPKRYQTPYLTHTKLYSDPENEP